MGFNSSHSLGESCNLLEPVCQIGLFTGRGVEGYGMAWGETLNGKAEAFVSIAAIFSMIRNFHSKLSSSTGQQVVEICVSEFQIQKTHVTKNE